MRKILVLAAALFMAPQVMMSNSEAAEFKFIALGDMPYGPAEKVYPPFETLIETINARKPAFSIHIGDTKSSRTPCTDQVLDEQKGFLQSFEGPVVYTPGDNEWTDCHSARAGGYDPRERLQYIRKTYFGNPSQSFGQSPMPVESQAVIMAEKYSGFPENIQFSRDGVHFVAAHVVGSNNGFETVSLEATKEFFERDEANVTWLNDAFDKAEASKAKAMVVAIHANMFEFGFGPFWNAEGFLRHSGFKNFGETLVARASAFKRPVLLIFGDSHKFRVLRPFEKSAPNITALEVYGARDMHAVEVGVDTNDPAVFSVKPVFNPALLD